MKRARATRPADEVERPNGPPASDDILVPGRNCWRVARATKFRCVQDADLYFRLVRRAILAARRTIFVLGWDIYAAVDLVPGGADDGAPTKLAELLDFAVRRTPELEVRVLVWDYAALYALERDPTSRIRLGWITHERVHFHYDDVHPITASHHQKVVVVDDALAFSGGLDLTHHRWDTTAHEADDPRRKSATGEPYTPFHDVQALVEGPVAEALGELARDRWRRIGATSLPPVSASTESLWPEDVEPDLVGVDVAVARTEPDFRGRPGVHECEALFLDEIAAAKTTIYAENQYFTSAKLGDALAARLREPDGPEIVFVGPKDCSGWLEQKTMGVLRHAVLVKLLEADAHERLRLLHPIASRAKDVCTFVHSKILVVDDAHMRIGSANFTSRSLGMDTECDLVAVAGADPEKRRGVRAVRDRLVGEHLGISGEEVTRAVERAGSLGAAIDELSRAGDKTLLRVVVDRDQPADTLSALRFAVDPEEPMDLSRTIDRLLPALERDDEDKKKRALFAAACVFGLLAIGARGASGIASLESLTVHQMLLEVARDAGALRWIAAMTFAAGLLFVPFELLVLVPVFLLGPVHGGLVAIGANALGAAIGYGVGRALGPGPIAPLLGRRADRIWSGLRRYGVLSVAVVRLVALFSATSVSVLCGAARVRGSDYAIGTLLGLAPALFASTILGTLLRRAVLDPSPAKYASVGLAAVALAIVILRLRRIVLMRTRGSVTREHARRAQFG